MSVIMKQTERLILNLFHETFKHPAQFPSEALVMEPQISCVGTRP
jgi:hypothetical protein